MSREPKAKVVFRRKTTFALSDHKTSLSIRVWLRAHTEVYTEVKQLGPGGRREFDVSIFETTFETSVWRRYFSALCPRISIGKKISVGPSKRSQHSVQTWKKQNTRDRPTPTADNLAQGPTSPVRGSSSCAAPWLDHGS